VGVDCVFFLCLKQSSILSVAKVSDLSGVMLKLGLKAATEVLLGSVVTVVIPIILLPLIILFMFLHLADAFIQSDLQMKI